MLYIHSYMYKLQYVNVFKDGLAQFFAFSLENMHKYICAICLLYVRLIPACIQKLLHGH